MKTTTTFSTTLGAPLRGAAHAALWLALAIAAAPAAAQLCTIGTRSAPACDLGLGDLQGAAAADLVLPADFVGTRSVSSAPTYLGIDSCRNRFLARVSGEGRWTRLSVRPRSGPQSGWDECTCANMVAEVQVISFAKHSYCQGGCSDCTTAEYCHDPEQCYQCSWTPLGLASWPVESKRATGVWVTASPFTGAAHCELRVNFHRDVASPAWEGDGGLVGAVVYDKRTGTRYPVTVEARNSIADPVVTGGGCPSC